MRHPAEVTKTPTRHFLMSWPRTARCSHLRRVVYLPKWTSSFRSGWQLRYFAVVVQLDLGTTFRRSPRHKPCTNRVIAALATSHISIQCQHCKNEGISLKSQLVFFNLNPAFGRYPFGDISVSNYLFNNNDDRWTGHLSKIFAEMAFNASLLLCFLMNNTMVMSCDWALKNCALIVPRSFCCPQQCSNIHD